MLPTILLAYYLPACRCRPPSEPLKPLKAFILDEQPLKPLKHLNGPLLAFIFDMRGKKCKNMYFNAILPA